MGQRLDRAGLRVVADMTANNNWPDKPGVPLNPERDGWHWLKARSDNLKATWREKFPAQWTAGNRHWIHGTYAPEYAAENWTYLGPCLTPDQATALQKRVAKLEGLVQCLIDEDPNDIAADGGVTVLDVWRKEARAALERKKDD